MIAVLDACVLYPAPLRDFLLHLTVLDVFSARWTEKIHQEWIRNVLKDRPDIKASQLERTRKLMDLHARDCIVSGYEYLIEGVELPDPDDRHVLAAAIHSGAKAIITFNLRDFPDNICNKNGISAVHPDRFIVESFDENQEYINLAFDRQLSSLRSPPISRRSLLEIFRKQGLKETSLLLSKDKRIK